jgi:hypothetical protein
MGMMSMITLMDVASGVYKVTTLSSVYEIDLTGSRLRRMPSVDDAESSILRRDADWIDIVAVESIDVGRGMVLLIDLHVEGVLATTRRSTTVVSIEAIGEDEG